MNAEVRPYRTRYAPSPTGPMHMGHARTALVAWLRARQRGGAIVMRIEDLDGPRVREGAEDAILRDHAWLGLDWDEGPVRQSARFDAYAEALEGLGDRVFPCSCTRREVQAVSAPHEGEGRPSYPGTCRNGPQHLDRPHALRFRMDESPRVSDGWYGVIPPARDDFIVRRSDGLFAYQLAVVVDDAAARISEVVRGADLLDSTPKQVALYDALGARPPAWLHLPLVRNEAGERLAKRRGAPAIAEYREAGWSREQVLGLLARSLGFHVEGRGVQLAELAERFSVEACDGGCAFDQIAAP